MVLSTSIDGFTVGTPVEALTDGRDALLAVGMNGEPLPTEHGYPARLVVPGLYGYVSATKWVVDLELTRFDKDEAYWTRLGWSARGPIKTESRIDVPRSGQDVARGPVTFGGVAWAQNRGVKAVEVRIDDGHWRQAQLGAGYSNDTWRLWSFGWQADSPGSHTITVRATDNAGAVQTEQWADPIPDGATGWHSVDFAVKWFAGSGFTDDLEFRVGSEQLDKAATDDLMIVDQEDPHHRKVLPAEAAGSKSATDPSVSNMLTRAPYYKCPGPSGESPGRPAAIASASALALWRPPWGPASAAPRYSGRPGSRKRRPVIFSIRIRTK